MRSDAQPRKPTFLWQGVLILLPVVLMAGFGFWAILRERNAVDQEARQQAQSILQSLHSLPGDGGFGPLAGERLTRFSQMKYRWLFSEMVAADWPGSDQRKQMQTNASPTLANDLATLHTACPEWQSGPVPLVEFMLEPNSGVPASRETFSLYSSPGRPPHNWSRTSPAAFPLSASPDSWYVLSGFPQNPTLPQPADWLATLSFAQYQAWTALQTAAYTSPSTTNLAVSSAAFQRTQPPAAALACAKFWQVRQLSSTRSASNAINLLLNFARDNDSEISDRAVPVWTNHPGPIFSAPVHLYNSDSGVPLPTLALAEALRRARECGPSQPLWEALLAEASTPDALTPKLLETAGRLVANNPQLAESVQAMQLLLADKMASYDLAEAVRQTGAFQGHGSNFWMNALGRRWFCVMEPAYPAPVGDPGNQRDVPFWVYCYPPSIVTGSFADAFKDAHLSLPDYFGVSVELAGEPVALPYPFGKAGPGNSANDLLAQASFSMLRNNPDFYPMPRSPQFTLQIRLTDRPLLYARQRRLQWIFGSMVAASALAALVGCLAAYRAFRRQQELSELKSNFVSSVSHELRAPIASVRLMAENLDGGKIPEPARRQEYYQFIVQECRRLSSLIENVLDFSRIEQGRKQYEFEPTDLLRLTRTTVQLMEPYAKEKGVTLRLALPERRSPTGLHLTTDQSRQELTNNLPPAVPGVRPSPGAASDGGESPSELPKDLPPADVAAPGTGALRNENPIELNVDGRALQQALVNLLDNAIKHSAKGETVTVGLEQVSPAPAPERRSPTGLHLTTDQSRQELTNNRPPAVPGVRPSPGAASDGGESPSVLPKDLPPADVAAPGTGAPPVIHLWVSDHGPGIPAAEHERIFERFYRRGSELRRETQGVGIGLSIVKHILTAHGGRVLVDSVPGRGSRFTLELPAEKVESGKAETGSIEK